jgi:hypothetical protein
MVVGAVPAPTAAPAAAAHADCRAKAPAPTYAAATGTAEGGTAAGATIASKNTPRATACAHEMRARSRDPLDAWVQSVAQADRFAARVREPCTTARAHLAHVCVRCGACADTAAEVVGRGLLRTRDASEIAGSSRHVWVRSVAQADRFAARVREPCTTAHAHLAHVRVRCGACADTAAEVVGRGLLRTRDASEIAASSRHHVWVQSVAGPTALLRACESPARPRALTWRTRASGARPTPMPPTRVPRGAACAQERRSDIATSTRASLQCENARRATRATRERVGARMTQAQMPKQRAEIEATHPRSPVGSQIRKQRLRLTA